ncbi:hypothetical protein [Corynebacterium minutissimum]|uniref:Uncharacterized protein n=1 Tax=Corynebacterium minutissimum TaxID=38301 RepID=A0A376CWW2_9CORY|nr:hypothetical protein [Corynebacterium minutissimum]QRP60670.1 hypothetical protein I6J26_11040 [Corynebacterium minutissimum]STC76757.1 Uncharacterised protein [Corynebacterium minutissimum]
MSLIDDDDIFAARLVVRDTTPERNIIANIHDPIEFTFTDTMGSVPTLNAKWLRNHAGHSALNGPCYVTLELRVDYHPDEHKEWAALGPHWQEYANTTFYATEQNWDRVGNPPTVDGNFVGLLGLLEASVVGTNNLNSDGMRVFNEMSPGEIIRILLTEAHQRGEATALRLDGNLARTDIDVDSLGLPWVNLNPDGTERMTHNSDGQQVPDKLLITREFSPETTLLSIIQSWVDTGLIRVWTSEFQLHMSVKDGWTKKFNTQDWKRARIRDINLPSSPDKRIWANTFDSVTIIGEKGFTYHLQSGGTNNPYGRRAKVIQAAGVNNNKDADLIARNALQDGNKTSEEWTREYTYAGLKATPTIPLRHVMVDDIIFVDDDKGGLQRVRVKDMSLSLKPDGTYYITFGSSSSSSKPMTEDRVVTAAKRSVYIGNGAVVLPTGLPQRTKGGSPDIYARRSFDQNDTIGVNAQSANKYASAGIYWGNRGSGAMKRAQHLTHVDVDKNRVELFGGHSREGGKLTVSQDGVYAYGQTIQLMAQQLLDIRAPRGLKLQLPEQNVWNNNTGKPWPPFIPWIDLGYNFKMIRTDVLALYFAEIMTTSPGFWDTFIGRMSEKAAFRKAVKDIIG